MIPLDIAPAQLDHALAVAARAPEEYRRLAFFHDALEDDWSPVCLRYLGTVERMALKLLTRKEGQTYEEYITRILSRGGQVGRAAAIVKVVDLEHNLSRLDAERESLRPRYEAARERIWVRLHELGVYHISQ